ncbi:MAG: sugar phosphate nucleotidyltransferase [Candidatus Omnitrophica bacterium]|nr:sugar phosphate nucleotidyltransferase [Candidatus Omnitrophota bacterium]MDD5591880.1 sugar phosphate nucleotidyltransferase [Candidatus Omnitrophota bacterium]
MLTKNILIQEDESIKDALKKLDKTATKVLSVVDKKDKLLGTITDGDIRRYILKGKSLEGNIRDIYNKKPIFINQDAFSIEEAREMFIKNKIDLIPITDKAERVIDFITWDKAFSDGSQGLFNIGKVSVPAVIMAGGKGTRLEPFSNIFPKALIPIGEKPIIEIIIDKFRRSGINEYYLTLNYKGKMIESYFDSIEKDYAVHYVWDSEYSGTAASLKLMEGKICDNFILSNCDVIVEANFEEVLNLHKEQKALLTILSSIQHYKVPYGVIRFKEGGEVTETIEKPEYTFTINTGVYILNKESLRFIPKNSYFDMTDLIKTLIENNKKVITYPVNESEYIDIGHWEEYKKAIEKLKIIE